MGWDLIWFSHLVLDRIITKSVTWTMKNFILHSFQITSTDKWCRNTQKALIEGSGRSWEDYVLDFCHCKVAEMKIMLSLKYPIIWSAHTLRFAHATVNLSNCVFMFFSTTEEKSGLGFLQIGISETNITNTVIILKPTEGWAEQQGDDKWSEGRWWHDWIAIVCGIRCLHWGEAFPLALWTVRYQEPIETTIVELFQSDLDFIANKQGLQSSSASNSHIFWAVK